MPDGGATWLLPNFVGAKRVLELIFGEKLGADRQWNGSGESVYCQTTTSRLRQ